MVEPLQLRGYINAEINAIFYLVIILNIATNPNTLISLENKILNFIGRLSYGIYMYHMIIIYLLSYIFQYYELKFNYYAIQILVLIITFIVSKFSYKYIESWFLVLKYRFMVVKSSNNLPHEKT